MDVTLDVYLDGKLWESIDKDRFPLKKAGRSVDLVSRQSGIVRSLPGDAWIKRLPSFRTLNWEVKPGDFVTKTIDCYTRPGCAQIVADTEEEADRDLEAIHEIEPLGLIDYAVICPNPPVIGAVVIVDPFSSGANMAAQVLKWGYKLILVFSEKDSPVASLVTKGTSFNPTLLIQHDATNSDQDAAIQSTLDQITNNGAPVLAILPGAETGVELADHLAARFGTRCNGEELTEARRNKYKMQEVVRKSGARAVIQKLAASEEEVRVFLKQLRDSNPEGDFKCVLKPNESAGTDHVFLCSSEEEAIKAFHAIHGQINGLGKVNRGALCQEFLSGTEYVIDGVSRDGIYKVVSIWEYDKRSVNGSNFVYFGMKLRDGKDPDMRVLIAYAQQVINALKIHQGPTHMEVILTPVKRNGTVEYSPCLVEVGSRCHGGEGTWIPIVNECIGYNQVIPLLSSAPPNNNYFKQIDAALSLYLRPDNFDNLPFEPHLHNHGCEVFLVSHEHGLILDIPGLERVRSLPSVV